MKETKTAMLTIYLEPSLKEAIRETAFREKCTMGELVRRAMGDKIEGDFLTRHQGNNQENSEQDVSVPTA